MLVEAGDADDAAGRRPFHALQLAAHQNVQVADGGPRAVPAAAQLLQRQPRRHLQPAANISILQRWLDIDTELPFLSHLTARSYTHMTFQYLSAGSYIDADAGSYIDT